MPRSRGFHALGWEALEGRDLPSAAPMSAGPSPTAPVQRADTYSVLRLASNLRQAAQGKADIVMLGDSLTDMWPARGAASWTSLMVPRGAVSFGIYGNTTGELLAQIAAGELQGKPKVVVLMIGTNNIVRGNTPAQVAQGIAANVAAIRAASPKSHIVLMGVLPLLGAGGTQTQKVTLVNSMIARLDDGARIHYLNINSDFLLPDGTQNRAMYTDAAHLSALGYSTWARRISGTLDALTGRPGPPPPRPLTPPPAPPPTAWPRARRFA